MLIAGARSTFDKVCFDEHTCDDWHLYGVDLCLSAKMIGIESYVVPAELYHKSSGFISFGFIRTLKKIIKKHKRNYKKIYTTCIYVYTSLIESSMYLIKLLWFHVIKKRLQQLR